MSSSRRKKASKAVSRVAAVWERWKRGGGGKRKGQTPTHENAFPGDVYDYIDAGGENNGNGSAEGSRPKTGVKMKPDSKGAGSQVQYRYPAADGRRKTNEAGTNYGDEPLYTSASQIYSQAGSEDPYR